MEGSWPGVVVLTDTPRPGGGAPPSPYTEGRASRLFLGAPSPWYLILGKECVCQGCRDRGKNTGLGQKVNVWGL